MPQPDFYTINLGRAFPLVDSAAAEPWFPCFANAEVVVRPDAGYRDGFNTISLVAAGTAPASLQAALALPAGTYRFAVLEANTVELDGQVMVFTVLANAGRYSRAFGIPISKQVIFQAIGIPYSGPNVAGSVDLWEGWMAFGELDEFPPQAVRITSALPLEPTRVKNISELAVRTDVGGVHIYNEQRTIYRPPTGCEHTVAIDSGSNAAFVKACGPITDPVRLGGGFQITASLQPGNGLVTFLGEPGGGDLPTTCGSLPLSDSEQPRNGFDLDGAPRCGDVLRRVNGAQGPDIQFRGVSGVNVGAFPDLNRVVISISGDTLVTCPEYTQPQAVEYIPTNSLGVPCGDGGGYPPVPGGEDYVPSSTTTQGPASSVGNINCVGKCEWQRASLTSPWQLVSSECTGPCGCDSPEDITTGNLVIATGCFEVDVDDSDNAVRNPDFTLVPATSGWELIGSVSIVNQHPSLADTEFPMALLTGGSGMPVMLRQSLIRVAPRAKYDLLADYLLFSGATVTFRIKSLAGNVLLERTVNDQEYRSNYRLGHFATSDDGVTLEVVLPESIPASRDALVSRLTLLRSR